MGPPRASCSRIEGSTNSRIRTDASVPMRDNRSRMAALANRRIRVALYSSRSIPGTYVACHQHAGLFPVGPSVGKPVFDDPLPERLGNHRPRVADAELPGHHAPVFVRGGGGNAVHHAVGEGALVRQPPGENRISAPGKGEDRSEEHTSP